ncbi:MAG: patatin-like phospholipase family protein [Actinomycetota bacterium]|nr:patatin-like phospholipase family protein [Actinomycetota bacterium]
MAEFATRIVPYKPAGPSKLGLALSGGGFRTAFFHIGVLLRLAELGALKHVEVLATVSGGSTVGAVFYIKLLHRLTESGGSPLEDGDLAALVTEMAEAFPGCVKRNVRVRTFSNYFRNLQMCQADYSRSDRFAELYDALFLEEANGLSPGLRMRDLEGVARIPYGAPSRGERPSLFLNATSLTTGRAWRFSPLTMGESALAGQARDIDKVTQFASPPRYDDLRKRPGDVPVSVAVAASSAFPGGLQPMAISDMYEGIRIQLTDGGVHDNQGIQTLIDMGCTHFIVSDTGGQMAPEEQARTSFVSVLLRTQKILYGRVRQEELFRASERRREEHAPTPLALIHLRKGEAVKRVPYLTTPTGTGDSQPLEQSSEVPGIDPRAVELLAGIRTDLDSFTEVEFKSLMTTGYLVADSAVSDPDWAGGEFLSTDPPPLGGEALGRHEVRGYLAHPTKEYLRQLKIGQSRFLKVFRLYTSLAILFLAAVVLAAGAAGWALARSWNSGISLGWLIVGVVVAAMGLLIPTTTWGAKALDTQAATILRWIRNALLTAWIAAVWSSLYLALLEPVFQRGGRLARLRKRGVPATPEAGSPRWTAE